MQYPDSDIRPASRETEAEDDSFHVEYTSENIAVVSYVEDGEQHHIILALAA